MITDYDVMVQKFRSEGRASPSFTQELVWLFQHASTVPWHFPNKNILELGTLGAISVCTLACAIARSMLVFPDHNISTKVVSVDNYSDYEKSGSTHATKSYEENCALVNEMEYSHIAELIKGDDIEYLMAVNDGSLGMLFVDSWHNYEHVLNTLSIAIPKMCNGAIICGHDYAFGNNGVVFAVEEWREKNKQLLCGFGTHYRNWWTLVRRT